VSDSTTCGNDADVMGDGVVATVPCMVLRRASPPGARLARA
jgi:hypothetical protein